MLCCVMLCLWKIEVKVCDWQFGQISVENKAPSCRQTRRTLVFEEFERGVVVRVFSRS